MRLGDRSGHLHVRSKSTSAVTPDRSVTRRSRCLVKTLGGTILKYTESLVS
jgi:hypothetical protein